MRCITSRRDETVTGRDMLMLIDWDDTIFCTTAVCDENGTPKA